MADQEHDAAVTSDSNMERQVADSTQSPDRLTVLVERSEDDDLVSHGEEEDATTNGARDGDSADDKVTQLPVTTIHEAAVCGDVDAIKRLVESGCSLLERDEHNRRPLSYAAEGGHLAAVRTLIKAGVDVEATDLSGDTAMSIAAGSGHGAIVAELLSSGADVNAKVTHNTTALSSAVKSGHLDVVLQLFQVGAILGTEELRLAAEFGHVSLVPVLIENGADVNASHPWKSALSSAAHGGHVDVIEELTKHGAIVDTPDSTGETALFFAAKAGQRSAVSTLLSKGAVLEAKDHGGRTALSHAAATQSSGVGALTLLISSGAAIDLNDLEGRTPLSYAANAQLRENVREMLRCAAFVSNDVSSDLLELFIAAAMGDDDTIKKLLTNGLSVDTKSSDGRTALFYAAECGQMDVVQLLLENGASVSATSNSLLPCRRSTTPLLLAGRAGNMKIFETIVLKEAPVNVRGDDEEGETTLISCARWDYFAGVQLLMKHGGALRSEDAAGGDCPLIPSTLKSMQRLCRATCELDPICTSLLARLQDICSQLEALDDSAAGTIVSFASIIFRFVQLILQFEKKRTPLARFIGSRAMKNKVEALHDELDHFLEMESNLPNNDEDWKAQLAKDEALVLQRFEDVLSTTEVLLSELSFMAWFDTSLLLQNELDVSIKERNANAEQALVRVLERYLPACHMVRTPPVPEWFLSPDEVEFYPWNLRRSDRGVDHYEGKWHKTSVMIEILKLANDVKRAATQWYPLSHPNLVKLFGACHFGSSKFFVYEFVPEGKQLQEFLKHEANRPLTWKLLYEAALGLQYLHKRGGVHSELQTDSIVVGSDLVAKLGELREHSLPFGIDGRTKYHWKAPETAIDQDCISAASDVFSFGRCIWEAVTHELPFGDDAPVMKVLRNAQNGTSPERPASMDDDYLWDLITKMCAFEPTERVNMDFVVNRLKHFVVESEQKTSDDVGSGVHTSSSSLEHQSLNEHGFAELEGATIPSMLSTIQSRCERLHDQPWMTERVLPALEFIFSLLQKRQLAPADVEVAKFCDALARFQRYVRTAVSEKSIFELARSRQVAESHHVVYSDLDRLLDMLDVPETDPIRVWKQAAGGSQVAYSGGSSSSTSYLRQANESSNAVSLKHFEASPPDNNHHDLWTRDGLLAESTANSPSWYLALRDLLFSEADQIGQGAFGAVYMGSWLDTPVVVKFMGYEEDSGSISTDLLLHEVRVWHRLNHPHVLKLYGASHVDKRYFVCEPASNGDLTDYLKKTNASNYVVWQKMHEAALGLEYLHGLGVAHNDLKCDNIMVGMDGRAKLIDFGLSCLLDVAEIQIDIKKMGALHWRSPEYLAGGRPSTASDVYSFAMCMIEVVSGDVPWGKTMMPTIVRIKVKKGLRPPLPEAMNDKQRNLMELMTKLDPTKRVKMGFVVDKLYEIVQDEKVAVAEGDAP